MLKHDISFFEQLYTPELILETPQNYIDPCMTKPCALKLDILFFLWTTTHPRIDPWYTPELYWSLLFQMTKPFLTVCQLDISFFEKPHIPELIFDTPQNYIDPCYFIHPRIDPWYTPELYWSLFQMTKPFLTVCQLDISFFEKPHIPELILETRQNYIDLFYYRWHSHSWLCPEVGYFFLWTTIHHWGKELYSNAGKTNANICKFLDFFCSKATS